MATGRSELEWLRDGSVDAVRDALARVAPDLSRGRIELLPWVDNRAEWHRNSAIVDGAWVAKFAWSEAAAEKLEREIHVLRALDDGRGSVFRRVAAWSSSPVLLVAPYVPGSPLTVDVVEALGSREKRRLAEELASVLAQLHDPAARTSLGSWADWLPAPRPQADTAELRAGVCPRLDDRRRLLAGSWCDWVDRTLTSDAETVLLHGDFHGHNLVVDDAVRVVCVLDLEEASMGDFHYDFRYLPAQEHTLGLFLRVVEAYEARTGRDVSPARVMAWHVRTVLGDALWRTEAGVPLPDGGTIDRWVDEIEVRFARSGIETAHT